MSNISADKIKSLRDKTGAGIMDCKNALVENNGEIESAIDWLRKKGIAKANKKSSRVAAEGLVGFRSEGDLSCLIEVNSETDFVSKNNDFQEFIDLLLNIAIKKKYTLEDFLSTEFNNAGTVGNALQNLISKIGENIVIRRLEYLEFRNEKSKFGFYMHNKVKDNLGKIGCITMGSFEQDNENISDILKKTAMHISAAKPLAFDKDGLDQQLVSKEREIFLEQLATSGKPKEILEKIVNGKINKFISEITLLNQNWILDPNKKVSEVIIDFNKENSCNFILEDYRLFVLGDGIETSSKDFKEEVASQLTQKS